MTPVRSGWDSGSFLRSGQAYQGVTYSKGAYVLSMLRSLMRAEYGTAGDPDQAFIDMMHDFMNVTGYSRVHGVLQGGC